MSAPRILFLCTGNSCRSQMAEGWMRHLYGEGFEVRSAGVEPRGVDPRAVRAMQEAGVDISAQRSTSVEELAGGEFDVVVTVCDNAREACPIYPARVRLLHRSFDDPPPLAAGAATEEEALEPYRRVRDEIRIFVEMLAEVLETEEEEE